MANRNDEVSMLRDAVSEVKRLGVSLRLSALKTVQERARLLGDESNGNDDGEQAARNNKPKGEKADSESRMLRDGIRSGMRDVIELKHASREAFLRGEAVARDMDAVKARAEAKELLLQNLLYEKAYLAREIERCLAFETKAAAVVPLVPKDEFKVTAPKHLLQDLEALAASDDGNAAALEHQTFLARLSHEMVLRQERTKRKQELVADISCAREATASRKRFLSDLPARMKGIVAAAKPVQETFGDPLIERLARHDRCRDLPDPLYMVYCHLEAFGDSFGGVELVVEQNENYRLSSEEQEQNKLGKRKRGQQDADQASMKSNKIPASSLSAVNEAEGFVDCGMIVKATLQSTSNDQAKVCLRFLYYPLSNVVTVEAVGQTGLLANLFPNDTGKRLPHLHLKPGITTAATSITTRLALFPENLQGRPFKWVQWLAGIYNPPLERDDTPAADRPPSTQRIVEAIIARVGAQASLSEQLKVLSKGQHPVPVHSSAQALFPPCVKARLQEWSDLSPDKADERLATVRLTRAAGIPTFYRSGAARETDATNLALSSWARFGRRCFLGKLSLPGHDKLYVEAVVQVFADYPRRAPHFTLFPAEDEALLAVQREVNEYPEELFAGDHLRLLSHQLRRLQMCLDVYAAVQDDEKVDDNAKDKKSSSIERKHRGRDRRLAFVYNSESRTFTHR